MGKMKKLVPYVLHKTELKQSDFNQSIGAMTTEAVKKCKQKPGHMWERTALMPQNEVVERKRSKRIPTAILLRSIELCIKECPWVYQAGVYYIGKTQYTQKQLDAMRKRVKNAKK